MLVMNSMASAQSARAYINSFKRLLNEYCIKYYNQDFAGRTYNEGSLYIDIPDDPEDLLDPLTGEFNLNGTHSYRGRTRNEHTGVAWRATIKPLGGNKYRIKFDKYYEEDRDPLFGFVINKAHWEKGPTRTYTYGSSQ